MTTRRLTRDEGAALWVLATEGRGCATTGDAPDELHPSWAPHLARLEKLGLVWSYPENGTLATDPGRTFYEITDEGLDALAGIKDEEHQS